MSNTADTAESLYKLIKISGSLQNLLFGGINIGSKLTIDFYKALGENKTLEHLNLDFEDEIFGLRAALTSDEISMMAKAVAFN